MKLRQILPLAIAILVVAAATAPVLHAGAAEDKADLIKLEGALNQMLVANDATALEARLAPDWKLVGEEGKITTREELLKFLQSGKMKFKSYDASELDVRVYGDAAVIIGRGRYSGSVDGEEFTSSDRFTDVFIRQDGKWRCVSTHTSSIE